jgi:hypothetical protein
VSGDDELAKIERNMVNSFAYGCLVAIALFVVFGAGCAAVFRFFRLAITGH